MKPQTTSIFKSLKVLLYFSLSLSFAQVSNVGGDKFSIVKNGSTLKIPFYANQGIFTTNTSINKAVIVVHGTNRNADNYFNTMQTAANSVPTQTANTLIIAPQFLIEEDIDAFSLDVEHLYWSNGGWKSGSNSKNEPTNPRPERIPSYAVLDSLLLHLSNKMPNLESIVFTGHSAGAQVAQRLAATSPMVDLLCTNSNINTHFVVANPSSYAYMDNQRKETGSTTTFSIPSTSCAYNEWKYGLDDLFTYPGLVGVDSIRNMNQRRIVTYLLGEDDNNPNSSSLDTTCEAMLQGAHRYERGQTFFNYLQHYYGNSITANQEFISVPNAGHNSFDMYNSSQGIFALFEKSFSSCNNNSLSVAEYSNETNINMHPNPTSHDLNITTKDNQVINAIKIYSLNGRKINQWNKNGSVIDIRNIPSGMYFIDIQVGNKSIVKKIIKD